MTEQVSVAIKAPPPSPYAPPGAPRPPRGDISRACIVLYGEPKIGKTTFASHFPGAWFVDTENGQDWLSVREPTRIESWDEFLAFCAYIQEHKPTHFSDGTPITTLVIDVVNVLYKHCFASVCAELGVEDPGEFTHGKGWSRISAEWERVFNKIRTWPYGLVLICHQRVRDFTAKASKQQKIEPDLGAAALRWCTGAADLILHAHKDTTVVFDKEGVAIGTQEARLLRAQPSSKAVAGGRMPGLPPTIPLDWNEFVKYFPGTPLANSTLADADNEARHTGNTEGIEPLGVGISSPENV